MGVSGWIGHPIVTPARPAERSIAMTDQMVLATQKWLNKTYAGRNGYNVVQENGRTGWEVIHGLLRALQIELGISVPSDNFGPGTTARYQAAPLAKPALKGATSNKYAILQGALWCKGYDAGHYGDLDDHYDDKVAAAVASLQADAGIGGDGSTVSVNLMKALLSMDQFRLIPGSGGDASVRSFQQELNGGFEAYSGLIPCDGIYDRGTNEAVIYAIQALEDMPVDVANGYFGPSTRSHCPDLDYSHGQVSYTGAVYSDARIRRFCRIANFCMYVNGFPSGTQADPFPEKIDPAKVREFQRKYAVAETGRINLSTWLSLCVSCGDTSRKGTACDTRFEITDAHVATLIANGYRHVGRYINGGSFKELRDGEAERITAAGLDLFLIYEDGAELAYFTEEQGTADASAAMKCAAKHGIPHSAVIFFAVDFDALDGEVTTNVLPYFKNLSGEMSGYRIGVYGPRNVCTRVCEAGYAEFSFVSDMSSGFSGNMGYPIPDGWSIDQISNVTITHGNDSLEIDNDLVSKDMAECFTPCCLPIPEITDQYVDPSFHLFRAKTNLWRGEIAITKNYHSTGNAEAIPGEVVAKLHYGSSYLARDLKPYHLKDVKGINPFPDATGLQFEIYANDGDGHLVHGYYTKVEVDGRTGSQGHYAWADSQENFADWNSNGTDLTSDDSNTFTLNGTRYRIFTLVHGTNWVSGSGGVVSSSGLLFAGMQIAIDPFVDCGRHWPYRILASFWRESSSAPWRSFTDRKTGAIVGAYVDMGLQYGAEPNNRILR